MPKIVRIITLYDKEDFQHELNEYLARGFKLVEGTFKVNYVANHTYRVILYSCIVEKEQP